jgi:hypothetical protein
MGARRKLRQHLLEACLAGRVDEKLLPPAEHDPFHLRHLGVRPDQHFLPFETWEGRGGALSFQQE